MNEVELQELAGGAIQVKFAQAFRNVMENLLDPNTAFKPKRKIVIELGFTQNESRDEVHVDISVSEKLAAQQSIGTNFSVGKDLRSGEIYAEEFGRAMKGQVNLEEQQEEEQPDEDGVIDLRKQRM